MANWFSRLWSSISTKASAFGGMIASISVGRAAWPDRNQELQAREGYQRNIIAYRCIRMVSEAAASVVLGLYEKDKRLDDHDLLKLLANPNPMQDGQALLEAFYSFLQITGNTYMERVDGLGGVPLELYVLRPDRTHVVPGAKGFPMGWEFTVNGQTRRIDMDVEKGILPILQVKLFHPLSDWYGMSPLDPAAWSVDTHSGAAQFNKSLLDNSAVPSGALKVKADPKATGPASTGNLSPEERETMRQEMEARFTGSRNAGRPMVLEGDMDWVSFGMNLKDLQFVDVKRDSAREIALAFGVPPMLLGIPGDNTYSNYQEARLAFWHETVIPLAERGARALGGWLIPAYQKGAKTTLKLKPELDSIGALASERKEAWDRVENSTSLTVNEKRIAHGLEKRAEGDVIVVPGKATLLHLIGKEEKPKDKDKP